jgi:hypothetical protein
LLEFPCSNEVFMSKLGIAMLAVGAALTVTTPASAKTIYDGRWSVSIVTEKGTCDRGYRYGIEIRNGVVHYDGSVVDLRGRVGAGGAVRVTLSRGEQSASGIGRLSRNFGRGTWSGAATGAACSGYWEAERR